jgi:hypothetical protein
MFYLLIPRSRVLLEKLTGFHLVKKLPAFMEPEGSLPHPHVPATCHYPEPARSSPHPHILLPEDSCEIYNYDVFLTYISVKGFLIVLFLHATKGDFHVRKIFSLNVSFEITFKILFLKCFPTWN